MRDHPLNHPPASPDATVAWLEAVLDGRMDMNVVLLRRLLKLARQAAASDVGRAANKSSRNRHWRDVVDDCQSQPGVKSRRDACLMAAGILGVNHNTLRSVAGRTPEWMKKPENASGK